MHAVLSFIVNSDTILFRKSKTHTRYSLRMSSPLCFVRNCSEIIVVYDAIQFKKSAISKFKELK